MQSKSISTAMAEFYLDRISLNEATTKEDLLRAGFSSEKIRAHATRASEIAAKKLNARSSGKRKAA